MTVETLIANAKGYAQSTINSAQRSLQDAGNLVRAVGYVTPNYQPALMPAKPAVREVVAPTQQQPIELLLPPEPPPMLEFQDIDTVDAGTLPEFTAIAPAFTTPDLPTAIQAFAGSAPSINTSFSFPTPPSLLTNPNFGDMPQMGSYRSPQKPQLTLPVFGGVMPTDNTQAPTDLEARFRSAHQGASTSMIAMMDGHIDGLIARHNPQYHQQMARIEAQLTKYLEGGTGLKPAVENAIYERARSKNDAEARRIQSAAYSDAASRGFTLPPGALMAAMGQSRQAAADNNAQAGREIVVMQAEMEQKNLQFAVSTSAALRQAMLSAALSYHGNVIGINGQALDYGKSVLSAIIEVYNTAIKVFGMKLDAYKADASVYETQLRAAMQGIEIYKAEIQALEALVSVDKAKVDIYRARIDSLSSLANVYRSQIDAVVSQAGMEKLKLEMFQSQVQAYSAQVQAKDSEFRGYTAAIDGQNALSKNFSIQAEVHNIQMQGFRAELDAKIETVKAIALSNSTKATQYSALLNGYSEVVKARGEVARTSIENQRQSVIAYQVGSQVAVANAQLQMEHYKAESSVSLENSRLNLSAQIEQARNTREFGNSIADLGVSSARVYESLASAAMSGMSTLVGQIKNE